MGGEWALGVALVIECWPDRFRPLLAGVIGAAGNLGYLLIGVPGVIVSRDAGTLAMDDVGLHGPGAIGTLHFDVSSRITAVEASRAKSPRLIRCAKSSPRD